MLHYMNNYIRRNLKATRNILKYLERLNDETKKRKKKEEKKKEHHATFG